jgi:hypothetical protein
MSTPDIRKALEDLMHAVVHYANGMPPKVVEAYEAARAALSSTSEDGEAVAHESFWLIESIPYGGAPLYWTGALKVHEDDHLSSPGRLALIPSTSANPNEAVRFVTQALAQAALDGMQHDYRIRVGCGIYKVTEHIWGA